MILQKLTDNCNKSKFELHNKLTPIHMLNKNDFGRNIIFFISKNIIVCGQNYYRKLK